MAYNRPMSYLTHLECSNCHQIYDSNLVQTFCPTCNTPFLARYDLLAARHGIDRDRLCTQPRGMWRWHDLLPVNDPANIVTLGEGDAPLLQLDRLGSDLDLPFVYAKDEGQNPTGSFKARGLAAAISKAKELGISRVIIPTAGNAGGAMAAYAARGGLAAYISMPADTPQANVLESQITGAAVEMVEGLISDAARLAGAKARAEGWFDMSTFKEPYRTEGKKIMGYELAESFNWSLPDVIIYPTGGGTGLVGMWKAFHEMAELGWLSDNRMPRMVAVQAEGCAPVVKSFEEGQPGCEFWQDAHTIASGLRVPKSFADRLIMQTIYDSRGTAVAVSDDEIIKQQKNLACREGIFTAPEAAATVAALVHLTHTGWLNSSDRIVLFLTGAGLKYLNLFSH